MQDCLFGELSWSDSPDPTGISGAWRRDLDPLPCGSLKEIFAGHGPGPAGGCVFSPAGSALLPFALEETEHQH